MSVIAADRRTLAAQRSASRRSPLRGLRSPRGVVGLVLVSVFVLAGLIPPLFMTWGPLEQSAHALAPAFSSGHLLGSDEVGRDILARVLGGIRLDVVLVIIAIPISAVLGTLLGTLGAVNEVAGGAAQWVFNVLLGFPGVVLGVVVAIALAPGRSAVLVAMVLTTIPVFGRQARVTTLAQMSRDYVAAAVIAGTPRWEIVWRHVLPNVLDSVLVRMSPAVSQAIQLEAALSIVGLGLQPPAPSLGQMIANGSAYLQVLPTYSLAPVVAVFVAILGLSLIGDAMNDAMLR